MTWAEVVDNPVLEDLPFRIELNRWGHIEMSRLSCRHGECEAAVAHLLHLHKPDGVCAIANGVETVENTKVPDVVWASLERRRTVSHEISWARVPEICVEIISPSNMLVEQMHKGQLYFQAGAEEFWLCDERGQMQFFGANGPLEHSRLCPDFPERVEIPD